MTYRESVGEESSLEGGAYPMACSIRTYTQVFSQIGAFQAFLQIQFHESKNPGTECYMYDYGFRVIYIYIR